MECYCIKVEGIPKESVHPGFRSFESYNEPDFYTLFLSVKGRLTNRQSNRANLNDRGLADALLNYWEPRLATRGWGKFTCSVTKERVDKWRERHIPKSTEEAIEFLSTHINSPIRTASKELGNIVVAVEGIRSESFPFDVAYLARDKKHGWLLTSSIANAQRYKSRTSGQRAIQQRIENPAFRQAARLHELSASELEELEKKKQSHWDFVFCRY